MDSINYETGEVIETYVYRVDGSGHNTIMMCTIGIIIVVGIGCYSLGRIVGKKLRNKRK